jgi:predicted nucleotidyltransferase
MLELRNASHALLSPVARVVEAAISATNGLTPDHVMVMGAWCHDIVHSALGKPSRPPPHATWTSRSPLSSWDAYRALTASFVRVGNSGIRFRIADADVDLLPFGEIEDPRGIVEPPTRKQTLSVWAFEEIFAASLPLALTGTLTIRIPTVPGYAAAKLGAWLDRSEWHESKDATDLALVMHWYAGYPHEG